MKRGKKRKERRREGGEGRSGGRNTWFLTFRMVKGRASDAQDLRSAWVTIWAYHDRILFTTLR